MGIRVKDLVKKLQEKDQEQVVEFAVVAADDGELVCMDIEKQAYDLAQLLQMFHRTPA